ncbi:zf-HC2 domain-containing protein [Streptomyces sp. NPDC004609]|uniref:zf-HC2 domain-containing protein n=1 Tax=Streptomyces sp. NPDC004609 TaxID=3364704 RepID=UPI0036CDAD99
MRDRQTNAWHVSAPLAARYTDGSAAEPDAWSLEKHIESCGPCAALVSAAARRGTAAPVLDRVRTAVLAEAAASARAPSPTRAVRAVARGAQAVQAVQVLRKVLAVRPRLLPTRAAPVGWTARMVWAAGPALRGPWFAGLLLVVAGALLLAYGTGFGEARPLLLALAPVLPLAGVALSYGPYADPMYEITATAPSGGLRLLLTRTAAVLAVCVPLLTAAGALLPPVSRVTGGGELPEAGEPVLSPGAWLLPGLALTVAALALGSYIGLRLAASALGCGWLAVVFPPALVSVPGRFGARIEPYVSGPAVQTAWAGAAVVCAGLLAVRRSTFDRLEKL